MRGGRSGTANPAAGIVGLAQPGLVTSMSATPRDTPISYHSVPETAGSLERPLVAQGYYAEQDLS